jgi:hypothetical protein
MRGLHGDYKPILQGYISQWKDTKDKAKLTDEIVEALKVAHQSKNTSKALPSDLSKVEQSLNKYPLGAQPFLESPYLVPQPLPLQKCWKTSQSR